MTSEAPELGSYSSNEENGEMTNGSESNTSLLQDDKLKKHLEKFSCDVDYLELKKFTNQELRAKAAEMKELTQQTEAKTLEVLAETNELNEKINTLESSTEIHRLLVNAVAEVHDKNCTKLSALQFTYNSLVDGFHELEALRLQSIADVDECGRMVNDAKKLAETILRKRDRDVNKKRTEVQKKTEAFNLEEEKKAALSNGILLLDKELAELKLRKKETLEAQSRRHAIARNIAAANVKKEEIREKLRQATKKKQDKEEMVKGQQERLTQKKAKSNDLLAKLNEVLSQGDLCRQKIEESKVEVRNAIATRLAQETEEIDRANTNLVMSMQSMLNTKTEQENVIADIQSKIANMSIQSQQLTRKVNAIKDEITFYEDQTAAIPTKNIKLTEEHDKLKSQLNQLQQTNIDFRQKINSKKGEYEKELDEAKKKKQILTKQLFPGRRSSSSGLCLSTSESGTSAVEEPFDNIEEIFKTATELPFVLEKMDVLNPSSSGYNDKNASSFRPQPDQNPSEKKTKKQKKKHTSFK